MKAVILAGGLGTRLAEETAVRPKPMVEIGGKPLLWHIMRTYAAFGVDEFVIACGYKSYVIKEYFANYALHASDVTFDLRKGGSVEVHQSSTEPWRVTLVDTGDATMTGGRLRRVKNYLTPGETFFATYGDGVGNIDIAALLAFHRASGAEATMTVVQPPGRFGAVKRNADRITAFTEKPMGDGNWINGGFFALELASLDSIVDDTTQWEAGPLETLAARGQLAAFEHRGFWHPVDTLRDKTHLEALWATGNAPWVAANPR
jgi:glucose-1-phosphate cytidylyltransferase